MFSFSTQQTCFSLSDTLTLLHGITPPPHGICSQWSYRAGASSQQANHKASTSSSRTGNSRCYKNRVDPVERQHSATCPLPRRFSYVLTFLSAAPHHPQHITFLTESANAALSCEQGALTDRRCLRCIDERLDGWRLEWMSDRVDGTGGKWRTTDLPTEGTT